MEASALRPWADLREPASQASLKPAPSPEVLVVDDDRAILRTMEINLRARGYEPLLAPDGRLALAPAIAARKHPSIVVLDLGLPDLDGLHLIEGLRGWTTVPIIVLSARTDEDDKVAALDAGANDYMTKPFGIAEFMARLRAALRVASPADQPQIVKTDDFTLDLSARRARRDGHDVPLTATEWEVVQLLARHPGRLITHAQLLEHVWGLKDTKNNTYAFTSPESGASSSLTRRTHATSSPSRGLECASIHATRPTGRQRPGPTVPTRARLHTICTAGGPICTRSSQLEGKLKAWEIVERRPQ